MVIPSSSAARCFRSFCDADPAHGAKPVVRAHAAEMIEVPIDDEGAFTDIDTREDYERIIGPLDKETL